MTLLWLPLALLSYGLQSVTGTVDRIIVHREVNKPEMISLYVALFSTATAGLLLVGVLPFDFAEQFKLVLPSGGIFLQIIAAGIMTQLGLYFIYRALVDGEVTRVNSVLGAVIPIVTAIAAYFFLSERLGANNLIAFAILILGTIVLTANFGTKKAASNAWVINSLAAATLWGMQAVLAKNIFDQHQFISAYALQGLGALLWAVILISASKTVRNQLFLEPKKPKDAKKNLAAKAQIKWIITNAIVGGVAILLLNLAISQGSPSLVNALRGVQYALLFVLAILLSRKFPSLLDEDLTKSAILQKTIGILFVIVGVGVIAFA